MKFALIFLLALATVALGAPKVNLDLKIEQQAREGTGPKTLMLEQKLVLTEKETTTVVGGGIKCKVTVTFPGRGAKAGDMHLQMEVFEADAPAGKLSAADAHTDANFGKKQTFWGARGRQPHRYHFTFTANR